MVAGDGAGGEGGLGGQTKRRANKSKTVSVGMCSCSAVSLARQTSEQFGTFEAKKQMGK